MALTVTVQPDYVTASVKGYQVIIRGAEVSIESSVAVGWSAVAESVVDPFTETEVPALAGRLVRWWYPGPGQVSFEWADVHGPHHVVTVLTVSEEGPLVRLVATDAVMGSAAVSRFAMRWRFLAGPADGSRPDFVWTPGLCPKPGQVIGQHLFRSPAAIVQHANVSLALLPDLERIAPSQPLGAYLMLDCPRNQLGPAILSVGVAAYRLDGHVYYTTEAVPPKSVADISLTFGCELHVDAFVPLMRGHQSASRYHWRRHGREYLRDIRPQVVPFARYFEYGYEFADHHLWRETTDRETGRLGPGTGRRVGAMASGREYPFDVWFQGWFNQLRSAWGLYWWARRLGDVERQARALATRDLVLAAPQDRGLFPTIAVLPERDGKIGVEWVASTLQGGGPELYHLLDCSWTAWWLLRWHEDFVFDECTLKFCRAYADALLALQRPDGGWPDYVDVRRHEPVTEYDPRPAADRTISAYVKQMVQHWGTKHLPTSAESAMDALFLAEMSRLVPNGRRYLDAAVRGATFLEEQVIPRHKWFDWETFFSCSPKPLDFYDGRTQQHPQNTMSLYWASECFRVLYEIIDIASHGEQAMSLMDYLCLYQQVWSPPYLSIYGFGGFGVMNTDGEWNDARQAVFAEGLAMQYLQSGRQEYLERAVAATRAAFACTFIPENATICPKIFDREPTGYADENYAHGGADVPAGASGFDWGIGSAITVAARMLDLFGDLWIDVAGGWALGIDGLVVTDCRQDDDTWYLEVTAPFRHAEEVTVKGNPGEGKSIRLVVNGRPQRTISEAQMHAGVTVRI